MYRRVNDQEDLSNECVNGRVMEKPLAALGFVTISPPLPGVEQQVESTGRFLSSRRC